MLREIKDLGFNRVELGHGIRISLMPGIQKMFEAGEVEFTSLHNFCPLPVEIMQASPDCYKISAAYSKERERAIKHTFQTIDFAERLGAPFVVLHCGEVEMNPITDELIALVRNGQLLSREKRVPLMIFCALGVTGAICGLSFGPSFAVATALLLVNSLGLATNFGLASTIVQERAPDYLRGRVSAVFMLSFVGLMPIAGLGVTSLSDFIGMKTALAIAAVVYGTITIFVLLRVRNECAQPGECVAELTTPAPSVVASVR